LAIKGTKIDQLFVNPVTILLFKDCYIMAQIPDLIILYHRNLCNDADEFFFKDFDSRIIENVIAFHMQLEKVGKDAAYFRWGELYAMVVALGYIFANGVRVDTGDSFAFVKPVDKNESKKYIHLKTSYEEAQDVVLTVKLARFDDFKKAIADVVINFQKNDKAIYVNL